MAVAVAAGVLLGGCGGMDDYSVSPNDRLAFSTDTLRFDTVFTSVGSATGYFMIYNRNDEALRISRISLASGGKSGFRINVDGRRGDVFEDIGIWKKDSLYVAVEVTVDPDDRGRPFVVYDSVVFVTNGVSQVVVLEAYGQNVHVLRDAVFDRDTVLGADLPYLVYGSVVIEEGATVKVSEGVEFYHHKGGWWNVKGTLRAEGSRDRPVVFRGDRLGYFSTTLSYDYVSAQWEGLYFAPGSFDNVLSYVEIRNGISGVYCDASSPERKKLDIRFSQIRNMDGNVLWAENCFIEASNSEFANASAYLVMLAGGRQRFVHCSLVNYMPDAMVSNKVARSARSLTLSDNVVYVYEATGEVVTVVYPLLEARFDNCIVDGNMKADSSELLMSSVGEVFDFRFNHCFVKSKQREGDEFTDCLFGASPEYVKSVPKMAAEPGEGERYDYVYDFRPAEGSVVIGRADMAVAAEFPYDRYGVGRRAGDGGASIGAYEYAGDEE